MTTRKQVKPILVLTDDESVLDNADGGANTTEDSDKEVDKNKIDDKDWRPLVTNQAVDINITNDAVDAEDIDLVIPGDEPVNVEGFWEFIDNLDWKDRAMNERYTTIATNILQKVGTVKKESIKTHMWNYINELKERFESEGTWDLLEAQCRKLHAHEQNALLSHVVARGQIYYVNMKADPVFACGLVGKECNRDVFKNFTAEF